MTSESDLRVGLGVVQLERDLLRVALAHVLPFVPIEERRNAVDLVLDAVNRAAPTAPMKTPAEVITLVQHATVVVCTLQSQLLPPLNAVADPRGPST